MAELPPGSIIEIGWEPLLDALRGARDPLLSEPLAELLIDTGTLGGELPPAESDQALALLPERLWALLLLVDALDRCLWAALSGPLGWRLTTYPGLAAAFVRSSYVHAIKASYGNDHAFALSEPQNEFVKMLAQRDPKQLLELEEEDVIAKLRTLFHDGLQDSLPNLNHPLACAMLEFLELSVYPSVVDLIGAPQGEREITQPKVGHE
ncbi:MAG: hypothetical protein ACRER2_10915 [Methylococcales bacterium]